MEIYYKNNNNSKLLKNRAETLGKWLEEYFNSEGCMCVSINNVSVFGHFLNEMEGCPG